jgi:hypothetical protein
MDREMWRIGRGWWIQGRGPGGHRSGRPPGPPRRSWPSANPRIHAHFTPTLGSWLNLVEVRFSIIERQAIHRGTFASVRDLMIKIRTFINGWNDRCQPFVWTKTRRNP